MTHRIRVKALKEIRAAFSVKCQCGSRVGVFINPEGLAHDPPVCQKFLDLDVVEFLQYLNLNPLDPRPP